LELSDASPARFPTFLVQRAAQLEVSGDEAQKDGVRRFRAALRRFVTLGRGREAPPCRAGEVLRRWPVPDRAQLLEGGEAWTAGSDRDWRINYDHVLDPVSGALSCRRLARGKPPVNLHIAPGVIPGLAHGACWRDPGTLSYILSTAPRKFVAITRPA
jgi:hypothetical protein